MAAEEASARTRNPQGEGFKLRQELIAAAGRLLASGSDDAPFSLRGVAREAGVAAPSVYLHFSSKDALLREVQEEHFSALRQAIEQGTMGISDPAAGLLAGCLAYCRYAIEWPGSYRIMFANPRPGKPVDSSEGRVGASAFQTLVDGVAECIAAGVARPGDPFRIASDIWPALHGMVTLRQAYVEFPWPRLEHQVRGILAAFTGIPYESDIAAEETHGGGTA